MKKIKTLLILAVGALSAAACGFPLFARVPDVTFTLNFIISGLKHDTSTAKIADSTRLLLPTAATMTVTLVADSGTAEAQTRTVSIGTETMVPVGFTAVPLGSYTVSAEAFAPDGTTLLFSRTAALTLDSAAVSVTLNLLPANPADLPALIGETVTFSLAAGEALTWLVPAGSPFFAGTRGVLVSGGEELSFFIQSMDGKTIESGTDSTPGIANSLPLDEDLCFTFYNKGSSDLQGISYQVAHSVSYLASPASGGLAPVDSGAWLSGASTVAKGGVSGAPIRDGITERLHWNTASDGSGTSYVFGQAIAIGTSNIVLYPIATATVDPANDSVLGKTGPGGGKVFHDKGTYDGGWRYLEIAPYDQAPLSALVMWSNITNALVSGTSADVGSGLANTLAMVGQAGYSSVIPNAASVCLEFSVENNGTVYDDWFLPSSGELGLIATNLIDAGLQGSRTVNGMDWDYWSSTETAASTASEWYYQDVSPYGTIFTLSKQKNTMMVVRAVRTFSNAGL
ncbi:MAG: DUF1566 domain-containing protein [Spirochaetes bacterium]|nr:DUF1566 domain-containing protein [Spirochaetota bacterium]MBU0955468.1 DUF1566 domain-containing protein [Spirochaetota bacterium]